MYIPFDSAITPWELVSNIIQRKYTSINVKWVLTIALGKTVKTRERCKCLPKESQLNQLWCIRIVGYNTEWVKKNDVALHIWIQNEPHNMSLSELNTSQSNFKNGSAC